MKKTKLYEVSNDIENDTHTMVPEGYAGFTKEQLEAMEKTVKEADKKRMIRQRQILKKHAEEEARLIELEKLNPPWKRQKDKYDALDKSGRPMANDGSELPVVNDGSELPAGQKPPKKKGCSSCAKKGFMGLLQGGAKLLKAELGIDAADDETMAKRKGLCLSCPIYDFGVCRETDDDGKDLGGCGCFVAAKIKLAGEKCPKGKW
tara:strand:+ start:49 stop:663 length:615 start_codon:yes stop_codon:yes gene_type:complete